MFDGIDTTWARFKGAARGPAERAVVESLPAAVTMAHTALDVLKPGSVAPALARVLRLLRVARAEGTCATAADCSGARADLASALMINEGRAAQALALAAGISIEATADRELVAVTDSVPVGIAVFNRGTLPVSILRATVSTSRDQALAIPGGELTLAPDSAGRMGGVVRPPAPSSAWWLRIPRPGDLFATAATLPGETAPNGLGGVAVAEDVRATSHVALTLRIAGEDVPLTVGPIVFRYADPVKGEQNRPLAGVNAVTLTFESALQYARANEPLDRTVRVTLRSASTTVRDVTLAVAAPRGLVADSVSRKVTLAPGETRDIYLRLRGRLAIGHHVVSLAATDAASGTVYANGYTTIEYDHIRPQRIFRDATLALEAVDVKVPATLTVAYVQGVGDAGASVLRQLDVPVTMLDPSTLARADLSKYTTVVVGPYVPPGGLTPESWIFLALSLLVAVTGGTLKFKVQETNYAKSEGHFSLDVIILRSNPANRR